MTPVPDTRPWFQHWPDNIPRSIDYPAISLPGLLSQAASRFKGKLFLKSSHTRYSFKEIDGLSTRLAASLIALGIKKGDRVSLLLENSIQYIVSYYTVILCGAIIVPLNTAAKSADIANWINHSESSILVTNQKLFNSLSENAIDSLSTIVIPDADINDASYWSRREEKEENIHELSEQIISDMPVTIMYTSGTTGKPKGVTLTHANFLHNFNKIIQYLHLTADDSILNILPFYYSYGNSVLHTHLMVGGTIVIENNFMYPVKSLEKIEKLRITGFSGVPATYAILLNRTNLSEHDLSSLRYVTQAGGAMPPSNIQRFSEQVVGADFYVMYGQTEATARLTYLEPSALSTKLGSVGKPLNGMTIEIRNEEGKVVENGIEGELYVNGPNIMKGYWNNKELTDQVLIDGFLKTGDLGHKDAEEYIFLTGRRSDMIKVGGNRISPLEVEEVVNQLDGIEEVAATGVEDEILGQVVKISVVLKAGSDINELKIKAYCKKNLALYKIPKFGTLKRLRY